MNQPSDWISLSTNVMGDSCVMPLGDIITDERTPDPSAVVEVQDFVEFVIRCIPPSQALFITHYFLGGVTMEKLGREIHLTESRVSQLVSLAIRTVRPPCMREAA